MGDHIVINKSPGFSTVRITVTAETPFGLKSRQMTVKKIGTDVIGFRDELFSIVEKMLRETYEEVE